VAVLTHASRGEEVITEAESHVFYYEAGGIAALAACQTRIIAGRRGAMDPERVETAIRAENIHFPRTALVCLENTHNRAGGAVLPPKTSRQWQRSPTGAGSPFTWMELESSTRR